MTRERVLSHDEVISDVALAAETRVMERRWVDEQPWELASADLSRPAKIGGIVFPALSRVQVWSRKPTEAVLGADTVVEGLSLAAKSSVHFDPDGRMTVGVLAKQTTVEEFALAAGTYVFLCKGKLEMFELLKPTVLRGVGCASGRVSLADGLLWAILAEPLRVRALQLPKGAQVLIGPDEKLVSVFFGEPRTTIDFYAGEPSKATLSVALEVGALRFPAGSTLEFSAGLLSGADLGDAMILGAVHAPKGTRVTFFDGGGVRGLDFSAAGPEIDVLGVRALTESYVELYPNGRLARFTPARATKIGETLVPRKAGVMLRADGSIEQLDMNWAEGSPLINGLPYVRNAQLKFHPTGAIESIELAEQTVIAGVSCCKSEFVQFHPSGHLKRACLAKDTTLEGKLYKAHVWVELDEAGHVVRTL
jgi:hypothetical protein